MVLPMLLVHSTALPGRPASIASGARGLAQLQSRAALRQTRCRAQRATVTANWNSFSWTKATVKDTNVIGEGLHSLHLIVPEDVAASYKLPGQFMQMRVGEDSKPAFIAVASAPNGGTATTLEFLVKRSEGTAGAICAMSKGDKIEVSPVMGKGFVLAPISPAEAFPNVFIFATGSGISPIRALIEATEENGGLAASKRNGGVRLWIGSRTAAHLPYADRFGAWERAGVKVTPVFSQGLGGCYVQDAFAATWGVRDPATTGSIMVGQKQMAEALNGMLTAAGVPKERIITNF